MEELKASEGLSPGDLRMCEHTRTQMHCGEGCWADGQSMAEWRVRWDPHGCCGVLPVSPTV